MARSNEQAVYFSNMYKAAQLDEKLDGFLNRLKKNSGIDTDDQTLKIFCAKSEKDEIEQLLDLELTTIEAELHQSVKVVVCAEEFGIERQKGVGSNIYYRTDAGRQGVVLGGLVVNLLNKKLFALSTCHRDNVLGKCFYMRSGEEDVELGKCIAVTSNTQPLNEACLVELSERGINLCCPCFAASDIKPPVVFCGPYRGDSYDLVPTEVLMCTDGLKRGTIKLTHYRFVDPEDESKLYSGGIVTMPIDDEDFVSPGQSGAFIGYASAQTYLVKDWCRSASLAQETFSADSIADGYRSALADGLVRTAEPIDDPSQNIVMMQVENVEATQIDPTTQVQVQSPPMSMSSGDYPNTGFQSALNSLTLAQTSQATPPTQVDVDHHQNSEIASRPTPEVSLMGQVDVNSASISVFEMLELAMDEGRRDHTTSTGAADEMLGATGDTPEELMLSDQGVTIRDETCGATGGAKTDVMLGAKGDAREDVMLRGPESTPTEQVLGAAGSTLEDAMPSATGNAPPNVMPSAIGDFQPDVMPGVMGDALPDVMPGTMDDFPPDVMPAAIDDSPPNVMAGTMNDSPQDVMPSATGDITADITLGATGGVPEALEDLTGGNTGATLISSENIQPCSCSLESSVMAHEAISMHCFGITRGEYKGGSLSFRLDLTLREFEEQMENTKFALVPLLRCPP